MFEQDADGLKAAAAASDAAALTLGLTTRQMQVGYASYLTLLKAEQIYQQFLIHPVQAQSNRYIDTAALFQPLGGGWWSRPDVSKN
jgi:outer membrane protein TolC